MRYEEMKKGNAALILAAFPLFLLIGCNQS